MKKPTYLRTALIGSVFCFSCTFGLIDSAHAQSTTTGATQGLATINVVARKKTENLQKVPLSITAISAKTLKTAHVENLHDLAALTPGVNITDIGAEVGTNITIRGVTDNTFGVGVPSAATFLDFAYLRDPSSINIAAIPLQQVEIVKNPVSALYGRDAYAGVLNYLPSRPTTTPHADISETAGQYGKSELQGDISGPILGDKVLGELFGDFDTFDGTYKDKVSGATGGSYTKKDWGGLLDINWSPIVTTHIDFYHGDDYFGNTAVEALNANCGPVTQPQADGSLGVSNSLYCGRIKTNGTVQINYDPQAGNPGNTRRTSFISGRTTVSIPFGQIDSITAATSIDERAYQAFDASSLPRYFLLSTGTSIAAPPNGQAVRESGFYGGASNTKDISEELRYTTPQELPIRAGLGGFVYSEARDVLSDASVSTQNIPAGDELYSVFGAFGVPISTWETPYGQPGANYNKSLQITDEQAAFGNVEADILPNLTISSEYRYTWLLQNFSIIKNQYTSVTYPFGGHINETNQYFSTNEAIRWTPIPNETLYFAFANGVKPGGFNGASTVAADESFGPETDLNYEGGAKTSLLDNRLQLDLAIYHIDTQNVQIYGPGSDPTNPATVIKNFGKTSNTGFELDARAIPIDGWSLVGGFSYTNPQFVPGSYDVADTSYCGLIPSCAVKEVTYKKLVSIPISGNIEPYVSKETFTLESEYDWLFKDEYPAFVRGDLAYRTSQFTDPAELTSIGPATTLDVFAGISQGRYTLSAYVKNLTNDETPTEAPYNVQLSYFQNVPTVDLPQGRTIAFTVAAKF